MEQVVPVFLNRHEWEAVQVLIEKEMDKYQYVFRAEYLWLEHMLKEIRRQTIGGQAVQMA